jgi:hypothetical protein
MAQPSGAHVRVDVPDDFNPQARGKAGWEGGEPAHLPLRDESIAAADPPPRYTVFG